MTDVQTDRIRTDGGTQPRCQINMFVVDEYAEAIEAGAEMPPPVVFFDGEDYWLADGFHRFRAYAKLGRESIPCDVNQGDRRDAVLHSVGANADHGLRRTNDDKRRAVETLLRDREWSKWSDNEIARRCNVSQPFVSKLRGSLITVISEPGERTYTDKHGNVTTMNTANIGGSKKRHVVGERLSNEQRSALAEAGLTDPKVVAQIEKAKPELREAVIEKVTTGEARNPRAALNQVQREQRRAEAKPVERDGFEVVQGDAVEVLSAMEDDSINLVVTDPPYGIDVHTTRTRGKDYADGEGYALDLLENTAEVLAKKCTPQAHLYFFSGYSHAWAFRDILRRYFDVQDNPLIWVKSRHTMAEERLWYAPKHEYIWFCRQRGADSPLMSWSADVLSFANQSDTDHSAEKPVDLLRFLISQSSVQGELVCDPFCGSGSTGEAAVGLSRAFVGIELDSKWVEVARGRAA